MGTSAAAFCLILNHWRQIMFTNEEKLFIRSKAAFARWNHAKIAIAGYTAVPASVSIWEFISTPNMKQLAAYLCIILATFILQVICSGKAAHYQSIISILKARLDHPPTNKSDEDLQTVNNSITINKES